MSSLWTRKHRACVSKWKGSSPGSGASRMPGPSPADLGFLSTGKIAGQTAGDRRHVLVSHLAQGIGGKRPAVPSSAVAHHRRALVRNDLGHAHLENAPADVDRTLDVLAGEFVLLPNVEDHGARLDQRRNLVRRNLLDSRPCLRNECQEFRWMLHVAPFPNGCREYIPQV